MHVKFGRNLHPKKVFARIDNYVTGWRKEPTKMPNVIWFKDRVILILLARKKKRKLCQSYKTKWWSQSKYKTGWMCILLERRMLRNVGLWRSLEGNVTWDRELKLICDMWTLRLFVSLLSTQFISLLICDSIGAKF